MPVLVVQLGHCHRKSGATGTAGEQEYAAGVGAACAQLLHGRGGWVVRQILADAPASEYRGDAFFAIHCDGSTSSTARGASIGYRTPEGQTAGQAWKRAYEARGWSGFRPDNYTSALSGYYGTGTAVAQGNRRAVILECGFRTNLEDRALLDGPGGAERVAYAIGDALGIPHTISDVSEEDIVKFMQGDSTVPRPEGGTYGDVVFKVVWPAKGPIAVRTRVPSGNDPGFKAAQATGEGMNPATGQPYRVAQTVIDAIPDAQ